MRNHEGGRKDSHQRETSKETEWKGTVSNETRFRYNDLDYFRQTGDVRKEVKEGKPLMKITRRR